MLTRMRSSSSGRLLASALYARRTCRVSRSGLVPLMSIGESTSRLMHHFPHVNAIAESSTDFRQVLWTGEHSQLVIMSIPPGGEIGEEVHHVDQHLTFTKGSAKAVVDGQEKDVGAGDVVVVPAGAKHNFINTGSYRLVLFTVYAPAEHSDKAVHHTKEEGDKLEEAGKDDPPKWATGDL